MKGRGGRRKGENETIFMFLRTYLSTQNTFCCPISFLHVQRGHFSKRSLCFNPESVSRIRKLFLLGFFCLACTGTAPTATAPASPPQNALTSQARLPEIAPLGGDHDFTLYSKIYHTLLSRKVFFFPLLSASASAACSCSRLGPLPSARTAPTSRTRDTRRRWRARHLSPTRSTS